MFLNIALFRNALLSEDDLRECVEAFISDVETESTDYIDYEELIHLGEKAARSKIEEIRKVIKLPFAKKIVSWSKKIIAGMGKRGNRIFNSASV